MAEKPLSQHPSSALSLGRLYLIFGLFITVSLIASWFTLLAPLREVLAARSWTETPCVVQASRVEEYRDSEGGSTYHPVIDYTYSHDGAEYRSSRYQLAAVPASVYQGEADVVDRYPPGARTVCYVNPEDPSEAVLNRDFDRAYLLMGLLPLAVALAGAGGMFFLMRGRARRAHARSLAPVVPAELAASGFGVTAPGPVNGPLELEPDMTPGCKLTGIIVLALIWNGITAGLLYRVVQSWRAGAGEGFLTVLSVLFSLVGLALIYAVFRQFLMLFLPRPRLTLSRGSLAPGEPVQLRWRFPGSTGKIQKLRIVLEGSESVRYRRGTNTYRDMDVFFSRAVAEVQSSQLAAGEARLEIPADSMPSFESQHNEIVWKLKVACEVPDWPDHFEEYPLVVLPPSRMGGME